MSYEDLGFKLHCDAAMSNDSTGAVSSTRTSAVVTAIAVASVFLGAAIARRSRWREDGTLIPLTFRPYSREELAGEAARLGFTEDEIYHLGPAIVQIPEPGDPDEIERAQILRRNADKFFAAPAGNYMRRKMSMDELRALDRLSAYDPNNALRNRDVFNYVLRKQDVLTGIKELDALPVHTLATAGLRPMFWDGYPSWDDAKKKAISKLSKMGEKAASSALRTSIRSAAENVVEDDYFTDFRSLQEAEDSGYLEALDSLFAKLSPGEMVSGDPVSISLWLKSLGSKAPKTWTSYGDLMEKLKKADPSTLSFDDEGLEAPRDPSHRVRDRLAQRDWDFATSNYPYEYKRGVRVGPALRQVVEQISELANKGETIFIHGRDGEILYEMLKRRPGTRMKNIHYGLTSRNITVWNKEPAHRDDRYGSHVTAHRRMQIEKFLKQIPPNAIHVDTGFEGSIPRHLAAQGLPVKQILMVSAVRPEEQFEIASENIPPYGRRDMVLNDLEYSAQRLNPPTVGSWGHIGYSPNAPGFWARLAGALGWKKETAS